MTSNYVLTSNLLAWRHTHPSTEEAFNAARVAVSRLMACLAVEEAFAVLHSNYVSFEKAVASANIQNMVERTNSIAELHSRRREIDRHLVNLLAAGEMFSDHVIGRAKKEFGRKSSAIDHLKGAFQEQRERLVGFWATECLRDAVLHNVLPITAWTTAGQWVDLETPDGSFSRIGPAARLEHSIAFTFTTDLLALDTKLDPALIERLKLERADPTGTVSWVHTIREYVEGLSMILGESRKIWAGVERAASDLLIRTADTYRSSLPEGHEPPLHVFLVEANSDGDWLRELLLNADLDGQVAELRRQHRPMVNLHRRFLVG